LGYISVAEGMGVSSTTFN